MEEPAQHGAADVAHAAQDDDRDALVQHRLAHQREQRVRVQPDQHAGHAALWALQQQVQAQRGAPRAMAIEQGIDAFPDRALLAQVQAQRQPRGVVGADFVEIPDLADAQREAAVELVLAQAALDHQDARCPRRGRDRPRAR
ncbi:hypothetical protein G6F24_017069 [Rhizopus arrhizus]|nr:hypothetical protein G6F24_017069 [Rhizopus arrhizus]